MIDRLLKFLTKGKALQFFHLSRQGAVILVAILLTKSDLGMESIGVYETLLYLGYIFSFFWVSGLIQGLLTIYPSKSEDEQGQIIFNSYLLFTSISFVVFLLLFFAKNYILQAFAGQSELQYFELFIIYSLFNLPTYLLENYYLLKDKPLWIIAFSILSFGMKFLIMVIPVFIGWDFVWSFYGLIVLAIVKHSWLLGFVWQNGIWTLDRNYLRYWVFLSLPLIGYAFIAGFNQSFGAWLVNFYYEGNERLFAIFRYGARELPLAMAMSNALGAVMLPEVAKNVKEALERIRTKSLKLMHILFPLSILFMLTSHLFFPIVFNPEFKESALIFNVFLLVLITRLLFPHIILIGLKANKVILMVSIFELLFNIGISFLLIYTFGLAGVAMGTVLAYMLEKVILCMYIQRRFNISWGTYVNKVWFLGYSLALVLAFVWSLNWHY